MYHKKISTQHGCHRSHICICVSQDQNVAYWNKSPQIPAFLCGSGHLKEYENACPAVTRRNDNVFITSKRRRRRRLDVMNALSLRHYCVMSPSGLLHGQWVGFIIGPVKVKQPCGILVNMCAYLVGCTVRIYHKVIYYDKWYLYISTMVSWDIHVCLYTLIYTKPQLYVYVAYAIAIIGMVVLLLPPISFNDLWTQCLAQKKGLNPL